MVFLRNWGASANLGGKWERLDPGRIWGLKCGMKWVGLGEQSSWYRILFDSESHMGYVATSLYKHWYGQGRSETNSSSWSHQLPKYFATDDHISSKYFPFIVDFGNLLIHYLANCRPRSWATKMESEENWCENPSVISHFLPVIEDHWSITITCGSSKKDYMNNFGRVQLSLEVK